MKPTLELALAALLALALPVGAAPALTTIGAAAAVHGRVSAVAPGAPVGRILSSGKPLFLNDHVTTNAVGRLQVLLADETIFTLGPDADMVLDKFVYDPATGAGKVAARIEKGAFRFVSGKIARRHPEDMAVRLKVGAIGIRGTVVVGETGASGSTVINAGAGPDNDADERPSAISVSNAGRSVLVTSPGEGVTVAPGQAPRGPLDLTSELDRISQSLQVAPSGKQASRGAITDPAKASGQNTAAGKALAALDAAQGEQSQGADSTQSSSEQQGVGVLDGTAQWTDLARLQGSASYQSPTVALACTGGGCGTNDQGDFQLSVNFDQRAITSGSISVSGSGFGSASSSINNIPFGTSGPATVTLTSGQVTDTNFNNSVISFINQGGIAASEAQMSVQYNNVTSNVHISGTLTAPKQ